MSKSWEEMSREERLRHNITKGSGEWASRFGFNSIDDVNAAFGDERPGRQTSVIRDGESFQDFVERQHTQASEQLAAIRDNTVDWAPLIAEHGNKVAAAQAVGQREADAIRAEADRIGFDLQQNGHSYIGMNNQVNNALYGPGGWGDAWTSGIPDGPDFRGPEGDFRQHSIVRDLILNAGLGLATGGGGLFGQLGRLSGILQGGSTLEDAVSAANTIYNLTDDRDRNPDFVMPDIGDDYTEGREQPTFENVSAEEMDFEISRGPREGETMLDWLNRLQNMNEVVGGGSSSAGSTAIGQMNPVLGGMQGELPPEIGGRPPEGVQVDPNHEEREDVAWVHQNPDGTWVAGNNMGEVWETDPPEGEEINDTPGVVIDDAQIADAGLVLGGLDPVLGGMVDATSGGSGNNSGNGAGSGSGQGSNGSNPGSSGNGSNSSGSGDNGGTGGIGQMDPVLGGMQGRGTGTGSGSGDGAGEGGGSGGENPQSDDGGSETPITDSLFGSVAQSDSSDLFPYTVIRPSRAAQLGGMMDYVAALNSRRRM